MNLNIVFEDSHLLVLYKPAGVPVQSARTGVPDCESMLKNYLYEKYPEKGSPYLGVVHRLDQPVEGLLVFAKNKTAARELSLQLQKGRMKKTYLAVCRSVDNFVKNGRENIKNGGKLNANVDKFVENWSEKVDFLRKNGQKGISEIVPEGTAGAQKAVLQYRIWKTSDCLKLLEIRLLTGRFHQIRVQMAGLGLPLEGDHKYGQTLADVDSVDKSYPALCAYRLEFQHPRTGKALNFQLSPQNPIFSPFLSLLEKSESIAVEIGQN